MPRGQPTAKRQPGVANQRDTRHENGLVGPGKRVQRQKSNGHLNGHAKQPESNSSTPPLPATPPPHTNGHARSALLADSHSVVDGKMGEVAIRRPSLGAYCESSSSESYHNVPGISVSLENHRQIDVNATKNPAVHRDAGPLGLMLTVLRSCPLYDTIAILIVLLQLPPTFLSLVHLLFATLTFVPPSNATTSGVSFTDIFEGTIGTPSIATIVVVDFLFLMIWLFLWSPLQDIALDLAQTVIALTLGGGTSGRETSMKNVLVCFSLVGVSHFSRSGTVKQSGLHALISSSNGILSSSDPDDPLEPMSLEASKKGTHGWIRSALAVHILAQGMVRFVRDLYVQRNLREKREISSSLNDPEAGKTLSDSANDSTALHAQTPDNDSSTSLPVSNTVSSKKKRKQSAQVRSRQPLWAALASTKIVMVKEYETSHTAAESAGTNATDINNLGNAPFNTEADRIWVTYVGPDQVYFSTSYFPAHTISDEEGVDSFGIDKSKPFFVRVNKTIWQPTRIDASTDSEQPAEQGTRWSGEIYGLAPASSYECEFVSTADEEVIFSISVQTLQPATADTSVGLSPNTQFSGRPGSPTTTLKTSIISSEAKLAEEKNRQKREKKEQRTKQNTIRKDIERFASNIASSGGNDDRTKQKIQQNNFHMKQAEDAVIELAAQIKSLESVPSDEAALYALSKSEFQEQKQQHKLFRVEVDETKQDTEHDIAALNNELTALQQKAEKLQARIAKLDSEQARIIDENARGLDEAQRKDQGRQLKDAERAKYEALYTERLVVLNAQVLETNATLQMLYRNIETLQQAEIYISQSPASSVPNLNANTGFVPEMNAEGLAANLYPWNPTPQGLPPMYGLGGYSASALSQTPVHRSRGRSSSMLSDLSGFTQSDDEEFGPGPAPVYPQQMGKAVWDEFDRERNGSSGSSGPASLGDPKSPLASVSKLAK